MDIFICALICVTVWYAQCHRVTFLGKPTNILRVQIVVFCRPIHNKKKHAHYLADRKVKHNTNGFSLPFHLPRDKNDRLEAV